MAALWSMYPQGQAGPSSYKDMTYRDVVSLTTVLSHAPASHLPQTSAQWRSYRSITQQEISNLPQRLLSRSNRGKNFKLSRSHSQEGELCNLHAPLNEALILSLFRVVKRQLEDKIPAAMNSVRNDRRASFQEKFGARLAPLNDVPSLWLHPQIFSTRYGFSPGKRFTYQADGCSACILARIGSDVDVLVALLAAMKMHMPEERTTISGSSVRISWVQQWIRQFPRKQCDSMLRMSDEMGGKLKSLHRQARTEGRRERLGEAVTKSKTEGRQATSQTNEESSGPNEGHKRFVQGWLEEVVDSGYEDSHELTSASSVYSDHAANTTELEIIERYRIHK